MSTLIPHASLPSGETVPRLGVGTWRMGESKAQFKTEVRVLQRAIDQGITLIDTAEMYGEGGAEEVVGEAVRGRRDGLFIVSKVYPHNASRRGALKACEQSLVRLGIDCLDLYLLHWRGRHPLADTVAAFEQLKAEGKIRHWGVSNFDTDDMRELAGVEGFAGAQMNQVYYNLGKRWPEATLLPWQREHGIATMAYSPLDQGALLAHPVVKAIAAAHGVGAAAVALAWLVRFEDVIAIPKTSRLEGVDDIRSATSVKLTADDLAELTSAFPPPRRDARMETT